ncbi:hypothetical protein [Shewanella sp.]|uniref:hypothetical protein n=1 Tax=Shewanella sp. TaxID=50422 RepID=UPI003A97ADBB
MGEIEKLSDLKLKCTKEDVLSYLVHEQKPILVKFPPNKNIWCVLKAPNKLLDIKYKVYRSVKEKIRDSEVENSLSIFKVIKLENIAYIELDSHIVVNSLARDGNFFIEDCELLVVYKDDGSFFKFGVAAVKSLFKNNLNGNKKKLNIFEIDLDDPILLFASVSEFLLVNKSVVSIPANNSALDYLSSVEINYDSIFVYYSDIKSLVVEELDQIPIDSPYFISPYLRDLTELDSLALIGHRIFGEDLSECVKTKDLQKIIENELGFSNSKTESAAFFLIPNPRQNAKIAQTESCEKYNYSEIPNDLVPKCQFPYLVEAVRIDHSPTAHEKKLKCSGREFLCGAGFSDEKLGHALMFIKEISKN